MTISCISRVFPRFLILSRLADVDPPLLLRIEWVLEMPFFGVVDGI